MSSPNERPLLPRPGGSNPPPLPNQFQHSKRHTVTIACEACRKRKSKCDAARPSCGACVQHGRQCIYRPRSTEIRGTVAKQQLEELTTRHQTLQASHASLEMLIHSLQESQDDVAAVIFDRLRQGSNMESIIRHIKAGDVLTQIFETSETNIHYEFPYRPHMPRALLAPSNSYLQRMLYNVTNISQQPIPQPQSSDEAVTGIFQSSSPYKRPYFTAEFVDARLGVVKPSQWTSVSASDDSMRQLLELYFLYEYQFFSCFQKDLFLDDMISGCEQFCSSLLVNAVLAIACNCCRNMRDRFEFWNPNSLGYKFFAEARRLWELELHNDSCITSVQAGLVMSVTYNLYALDKVGMTYTADAIMIARELNLFELPSSLRSSNYREWHGYGFTGWALYFWASLKCYLLRMPPLLADPPATPLPDSTAFPEWYGETYVRYPPDMQLYSLHQSDFFRKKCEISLIINRISGDLFRQEVDAPTDLTSLTQKLHEHIVNLGTWQSFLPQHLTPAQLTFPFDLNLHLLYLSAMIEVCEAILSTETDRDRLTGTMVNVKSHLSHSKMCFETVMRIYYLRHGYEIPDGHMAHNALQLAYIGLSQRQAPLGATSSLNTARVSPEEAKSTLILAAKGLADQGKNYFLPRALFQIIANEMSVGDKETLHRYSIVSDEDSDTLQSRHKFISSQYPIRKAQAGCTLETTRLDQLTKDIMTLALEKVQRISSASGT